MRLEKRSSFGWPATRADYATPRNGLVAHFDGSNQGLTGKPHSACRTYWKNTRAFHMGPNRRWLDIGYSFAVCPHGYVLEGRGLNRVQAAQPGGNSTWYSVTFMSGPGERPTSAQLQAWRELRAWLRGKGVAAAIKGHRNFISTDCPGDVLYGMVRSGALAAGSTSTNQEGNDMQPNDSVKVGATYDKDFQHESYPAAFVWVGAFAEAKRARAEVAALRSDLAEIKALLTKGQ